MTKSIAEAAPRRILPEGRLAGPMPWVIAIMIFLSVLAAAAGLSLSSAASSMQTRLAGKISVQLVEANPDTRVRQRSAVAQALRRMTGIGDVTEVSDDSVRALLAPWLGRDGLDPEIPVPALIDATVTDPSPAVLNDIGQRVRSIAPSVRIDRHADWLGPIGDLLVTLKWLAVALVVLAGGAMAAAVVLGTQAALDQHHATIDVMHLMGASDRQISRLFERRVGQDAITGAALGFVAAVGVFIVLGWRFAAVGAALAGNNRLGWSDWATIALLPVLGVGLAIASARIAILRALARIL